MAWAEKVVLIVSPQSWSHIRVSKHHYAEELAKAGANVYFLNPPSKSVIEHNVKVEPINEEFGTGSVSVVNWKRRTPRALRFKALPIYKQLIKRDIERIQSAIKQPIDLLWSFEPNTFPDLSAFLANQILYMPVDPLSRSAQISCARSADIIVSISKEILANFETPEFAGRTLLVEHGISNAFEAEARRPPEKSSCGSTIRAGFFGNLDRPIVNHRIFAQLAQTHQDVEFHFWGPYEVDGSFAGALGTLPNVIAHGAVEKFALVEVIRSIDIFLLIYGSDKHLYDRSNAHKILEYLCTGKVVVSSPIKRYAGRPDLLRVPDSGEDDDIPVLFARTLSELEAANARPLMAARKAYALQYSYRSQLKRIEHALNERKQSNDTG